MVHRHSWYNCYRTRDSLVYRENEGNELKEFKPDKTGLFRFVQVLKEVPTESHPIAVQKIDQRLWTRKPFKLAGQEGSEGKIHGVFNHNTLTSNCRKLDCGSDGSIYYAQ